MNRGTEENFLQQFPLALRPDSDLLAMARVMAGALEVHWNEAVLGTLYPRIEELPETMLDILAYDFKVDWWDRTYSIEEKRRTLKDSWRVHRMMGTRAAVETALSAVFQDVHAEEWFEYGGEPYHFRILVEVREGELFNREKHRQVISRVAYYKNLRSWMEVVRYQMPPIILENRPGSFLFRQLRILLSIWQNQSQQERLGILFRLWEEIRPPEAALRFLLQIGKERGEDGGERAIFQSLHVPLRARSYSRDMILLDGERLLDGSWLLGQRPRGMAWDHIRFTVPIREENRLTGTVERDTTWQLDGKYQLNGWRVLHEGILREEI